MRIGKFNPFLITMLFLAQNTVAINAGASNNRVLVFIGQNKKSMEDYVKKTGHVPAGFMSYTAIQDMSGITEPFDNGAGTHHIQYFINNYPDISVQIGLYMVDALDDTINGKYDRNIEEFAAWARLVDVPIYLRIGYEFDGPHNRYNPQKYVKAYRYIVDKLRDLKVKNVIYVWHSYAGKVVGDRMRWYPGDDYVDYFAITFFDAYNYANMEHIANQAKRHNKPLMIAEATPRGIDLSNAKKAWRNWFQRFFNFIERHNVKAISYINTDWESQPMFRGQGWGDTRVEVHEDLKKMWLDEMRKSKYVSSSKNW